jgi:two-component system, LytTR family, sensor histidine kinase AlgZ
MALSINHNAHTGALPDFRNLGILLRILLIVNGVVLLAALLQVQQLRDWPRQITGNAALVEPLLILSLLVLAALGRVLRRLLPLKRR